MTPPTTEAARQAAATRTGPAPSGGSHPRRLRRTSAPAAPRRVSGPVGGAAGPAVAPRVPTRSRPSAPARTRVRTAPRVRLAGDSLWPRAVAFVQSLPDRALIDRLVRGQAWIPVLGLMLAGIVAMQVEVLKLGASTGRAIEQTTRLSARNESLRASVATLGDDERIESVAARMGMIMPAPTGVGFLSGSGAKVGRARANIHAPDGTQFLNAPPGNGSVATTATNAASASSTGASTTGAPAATGTPTTGTPAATGTPTATGTNG